MELHSKNRHLNLYQFYSQGEEIENNLTRALAICLQHNPLFLRLFIEKIIGSSSSRQIFSHIEDDDFVQINIQESTLSIRQNMEGFNKIYGIALTTKNIQIPFDDSYHPTSRPGKSITDVFIGVKDFAFIIEAKRNSSDCSQQLLQQLSESAAQYEEIKGLVSLTWGDVLKLLLETQHVYKVLTQNSLFVSDFIKLIETHYVSWLPTQPFSQLSFPKSGEQKSFAKHYKRLEEIKNAMGVKLIEFRDRTSIPIDVDWASEVTPYFRKDGKENLLKVFVWPSNIKAQGWSLYKKDQSWQETTHIKIGENKFHLHIIPEIVFRHFNKFISQITFPKGSSELHNKVNFEKMSGKWKREKWSELEAWFDQNIDFDWRSSSKWQENFVDTERGYLTVSFGFEVVVDLPYSLLKKLDTQRDDKSKMVNLLRDIVKKLEHLV